MQDPTRDRMREFERPPSDLPPADEPPPPLPTSRSDESTAPPTGWIPQAAAEIVAALPRAVDVAPVVVALLVGLMVLRQRRWRALIGRVLLCISGAGIAGAAAWYGTYLLGCRVITCVDTAGLAPMLAGLGIGWVAGIVGLVVLWRATGRRAATERSSFKASASSR